MWVLTVNVTVVLNTFRFFILLEYSVYRLGCGLDDGGILAFFPGRDKRISFKGFKPALGLTSASYKHVLAAHPPAVKGLKREAELHFRGSERMGLHTPIHSTLTPLTFTSAYVWNEK
jgi:hypothetical protein